jgi:5-methylcytosine-specific restriction endonuclease McrA
LGGGLFTFEIIETLGGKDMGRKHKSEPWEVRRKRTIQKYYIQHRDKIREYEKIRYARKKDNPDSYDAFMLRLRISSYLKDGRERKHLEKILGYTIDNLKKHLEKQFREGMTWGNYCTEWQIDHIIPVSRFNITSINDFDFKRCWALDNLQPLWKEENRRKADKIMEPFQPALAINS